MISFWNLCHCSLTSIRLEFYTLVDYITQCRVLYCVQVRAVLVDGWKAPTEHVKLFDKYQPLFTREVPHLHTLIVFSVII